MENNETIENKIYNSRKDKIEILEDKNYFILYQIDKVNTRLPSLNNDKFRTNIKNILFQKKKYEFNKNIQDQINKKEFNQISFDKLANNEVKKIKLNSIKDNKKFEISSIEILYSLPVNTFTLIADDKDNIFLAKIINYEDQRISQNSDEFNTIYNEASTQNRNSLLKSYDYFLSSKYQVVVNEKTLDRVKNYFK